MTDPQYGPPSPNADRTFNELRRTFHRTIPRHMRNVRAAVLHMQQLRRMK